MDIFFFQTPACITAIMIIYVLKKCYTYLKIKKRKERHVGHGYLLLFNVYYTVFANKLLSCKAKKICIFQTIKIVYLFHPTYHNSQSIKQANTKNVLNIKGNNSNNFFPFENAHYIERINNI